MAADWDEPTVDSDYLTEVIPNLLSRDVDAATLEESPTNPPTGYKRWNTASSKLQKWNGTSWDDLVLSVAGGGTGASSASGARTALGIGSIATQDNNNVNITGGTISGVTLSASTITSGTVALARGGTGASLSLGSDGQVLGASSGAVAFMSGASIANLSASNLTSGTVPDARFPSTLPALNGSALTNLNASNLSSGTVPSARLPAMWPVGSIYISVDSTNPATTFGYGTWEAFGTGRTLVGINGADTDFDTVEETGGAKTVTLTTSQIPSHNHGVTDPGHTHNYDRTEWRSPITETFGDEAGDFHFVSNPTSSATTGISIQNAGGGGSHNNLQPYIVVYMWKRTA